MAREAIGIAVTVWLLAGCGSNEPAPTTTGPTFSEAHQCLRGGGVWWAILGVCDMQGTGVEMSPRR
jgi:hypothetical protein